MDIAKYLSSEMFNKQLEKYMRNISVESEDKTRNNFRTVASEAYNEGVMYMMTQFSTGSKKGPLEKQRQLASYLPDNFAKDKFGESAVESILNSIKDNQTEYVLNIGYESLLREDIVNIVRIIYAIGLTTGFEIAEDEDYKAMYLSNKDRFIKHGSIEKVKENKTNDKK